MGPVEVAVGAAALLVAAVVGTWLLMARRRREKQRRQEEVERGTDDAALRAEVLDRLERAASQWGVVAGTDADGDGGSRGDSESDRDGGGGDALRAGEPGPASSRTDAGAAADGLARHGRPGRRIGVRRDPRA